MKLASHSLLFILSLLTALGQSAGDDDDCQAVFETGDGGDQSGSASGVLNSPTSSVMPLAGSTPSSNPDTSSTESSPVTAPNNDTNNSTTGGSTDNDQPSSTGTKAPESDEIVPDGAAIYSPKGGMLDVADFTKWATDKFTNPDATPSHWIKIPAGEYKYYITDGGQQTVMFWGARNSKEPSQPGAKWTVDLRGCTFNVPIIKETDGNPPAAIYVAQSNDLRILGGTFWIDTGKELYSQGKITTMKNTDSSNSAINDITISVDQGYDMDIWSKLANGNWWVMDTSDKTNYRRPKTTFWGDTNPPSVNAGARTVSVSVNAAGLQEGYYVSLVTGVSTPSCISCEMDSNITVQGVTTNGGFWQYGLQAVKLAGEPDRLPETWMDCVITNPALRSEGQAPRVNGPTLLNAGSGGMLYPGVYNAVDADDSAEDHSINHNSKWQSTGCDCAADYLSLDVKDDPAT